VHGGMVVYGMMQYLVSYRLVCNLYYHIDGLEYQVYIIII